MAGPSVENPLSHDGCRPDTDRAGFARAVRAVAAIAALIAVITSGPDLAHARPPAPRVPAQGATLDTDDAVEMIGSGMDDGVFAQPGADVDLVGLAAVVEEASPHLDLGVAVFADPLADPDGVALAVLGSSTSADDSVVPSVLVVFAPDQFGRASLGVAESELNAAIIAAQESILTGTPVEASRSLARELEGRDGWEPGKALIGTGVAAVLIGLMMLSPLAQRIGGARRRARRHDVLRADADQLSPRIVGLAETVAGSSSASARLRYHELSALYGSAIDRLAETDPGDADLDAAERALLDVATGLDEATAEASTQ